MKRANPSASTYGFGINATAEPATEAPDMASIFERCANAMMNSQQQLQERQQQFESNMAASMAALQNQLNQAAAHHQNMFTNALQHNATMCVCVCVLVSDSTGLLHSGPPPGQ